MGRLYGRMAAWLGSAVLAATAAIHGRALPEITAAAEQSSLDPFLKSILEPLWLFPTIHWAVLALIAVVASFRSGSRLLLLAIAALLIADAATIFLNVGPFFGEAMLAAAAGCYLFASVALGKGPK